MKNFKMQVSVWFVKLSVCSTTAICIEILWQLLELVLYKKITPRLSDDIVCVVFAYSVYKNLHWTFAMTPKGGQK